MHKVYFVDDDVFVRRGIQTLINWETYGFTVCGEADNGEDALDDILEMKPDLVLTDIRMPVLDGLDLIKETKETLECPPYFIVISGYNDFKYAQRALRYNVKDFILKPVDQEEIQKTLLRISAMIKKDQEEKEQERHKRMMTDVQKYLFNEGWNEPIEMAAHPFLTGSSYTFVKVEINGLYNDYKEQFAAIEESLATMNSPVHSMWFEDNSNCFGLVINNIFLEDNQVNLEQFLREWKDELDDNMIIYCGETVSDIKKLYVSYHTAKTCIQYKYVLNKKVITSSMIQNKDIYYIDLDQSLYEQMMEYIEEKNPEKIEQQLDQMIAICREKSFAKDAIETVVNRLNHEILKTIKESEGNEEELAGLQEMLEWDQYALSLEQLKKHWLDFIHEAAHVLKNLSQNKINGAIYQIKKYIHSHYDQPLTLKSIATIFYMNPVYMGQLFKKTYGIYFKDYILQVRIDHAKKLLRKTDWKVYEIAENVGFTNADYFVTQFEKIVGATPTQYRKKVMEQIS